MKGDKGAIDIDTAHSIEQGRAGLQTQARLFRTLETEAVTRGAREDARAFDEAAVIVEQAARSLLHALAAHPRRA